MGLANSILEAVRKELLLYPGYRAAKVGVRIGAFAGVDGESLRFCFEAIVKGSSMDSLELGIESGKGDELDLGQIELEETCG
jgi:hydrogenase nickel incorporation protein HypA/HybF